MLFLEKAARSMNNFQLITERKCLKRPSNWGNMIPIDNASKYNRTVAVYVDDESLIIVIASACKWPF